MKKIIAVIVVVVLAVCGYIYYTPYLAIKNLAKAVQDKDTATVAQYIDSDSLKANISEQMNAMLTKKMMEDPEIKNNPFSVLALGMITPMVNAASTAFSSPDGMVQILNGQNPLNDEKKATSDTVENENPQLVSAQTYYEDMNTFDVLIKNPKEETVTLVFKRDGLTGWKMSKMILPPLGE